MLSSRKVRKALKTQENSLNKIGRQDLVPKTLSEAEKLMNEKLEEEKNKYNEEQNKKKERTK